MESRASRPIWASLSDSVTETAELPSIAGVRVNQRHIGGAYGEGEDLRIPIATEPSAKFFLSAGVMASTLMRHKLQIPLGTGLLAMAMGGVFLKPDGVSLKTSSLLPSKVVQDGEAYRLVSSAFVHRSATHFLLNTSSLIDSGSALETQMGAVPFLLDVSMLTVLSHGFYVGAAWLEKTVLGNSSTYSKNYSTGFSSVAFALGVLTGAMESSEPMLNPSSGHSPGLRVWGQLLVTSLFLPDSNLLAHISGIFVGLLRLFVPSPFLWLRRQTTRLLAFLLNRPLENRMDEERKLARYRSKESFYQHLCLLASSCVIYAVRQKRRAA